MLVLSVIKGKQTDFKYSLLLFSDRVCANALQTHVFPDLIEKHILYQLTLCYCLEGHWCQTVLSEDQFLLNITCSECSCFEMHKRGSVMK